MISVFAILLRVIYLKTRVTELVTRYRCARKTFFEKINFIDSNILQQSDLSITNDLIFGSEKLKNDKKNALLMSMIEFI